MEQEATIIEDMFTLHVEPYDEYTEVNILEKVAKESHYGIVKSCKEGKNHQKANAFSMSKEMRKDGLFLTKFHQMYNKTAYQKYNVAEDVTNTSITVSAVTPKWLVKVVETMQLNPKYMGMYDFTLIVDDVNFNINMHAINFSMTFDTKGLAFLDAYDLIRLFKSKTPKFLAFKANFKNNVSRFLQDYNQHSFIKDGVIVFDGQFAKDILGY